MLCRCMNQALLGLLFLFSMVCFSLSFIAAAFLGVGVLWVYLCTLSILFLGSLVLST